MPTLQEKHTRGWIPDKKILAISCAAIFILIVVGVLGTVLAYFVLTKNSAHNLLPTGNVIDKSTSSTTTTSTSITSSTTTTTEPTSTSTTTIVKITTSSLSKPSCSDNIKNQGEDDIDCGGPCVSCPNPAEETELCLSSKGITVYLRNNNVCLQCKAIRKYFGTAINLINTIDCDDDDNEDTCNDMFEEAEEQDKRKGYPTWDFFGELYPGASVGKIKSVTGC